MRDGNEYLDLPVPEADEPATFENILQFINAFCVVAGLDDKGWKCFRSGILSFANQQIREWHDNEICRIQDIGPKLWGFFRGYMSCNNYYYQQLKEIDMELKGLTGGKR